MSKTLPKKKPVSELPIVKKDATINVGKIYHVKEGDKLPKEIDKNFYSSFKTEGII